jgi:hypothetical protein
VSNGTHTEWNSGNKMRNDGVDIYACNDKITNKYYVGKTEKGEWLQYTVNNNLAKKYKLNIRYNESTQASELVIKTENGDDLGSIKLVPTGKAWKTVSVNNINLVKEKIN